MKTRNVFLLSLVMLFSCLSALAFEVDGFEKRFLLIREEGRLVEVRDNFLTEGFKIRPLLNYYRELISQEQGLMAQSPQAYQAQVEQTFLKTYEERPEHLTESLVALQEMDLEKIFNHPKFNELLNKFEVRLGEEVAKIGLVTLARPTDARFFYQRQVVYEVIKMFLNMARSQLEEVPVLNTAMFIIKEAERMIVKRRTFHQNMLMHYLENFTAEELGLSDEEAQTIWSSLYESRIPWFAFWESSAAVADWNGYGLSRFQIFRSNANTRLEQNRGHYDGLGNRLNFAFQDAKLKGKKVIVNLYDSQFMFSNKHSVAHYYDDPKLVSRQRTLLQLGQLGLSFLSLPGFVKDFASSFFKSMYENQRLTEGALVGHFESLQDEPMVRHVIRQNMNPFEL